MLPPYDLSRVTHIFEIWWELSFASILASRQAQFPLTINSMCMSTETYDVFCLFVFLHLCVLRWSQKSILDQSYARLEAEEALVGTEKLKEPIFEQ